MQSIKGKEKRHNELYENNVILQTEQILSIIQETPNSNLQPGVNFLNKENIKNSTHHILIACDHESKPVGMTTLIHANTETGSLKTSNLLEELRLDPSLINSSYWISTAIPNQQHRSQGLGRVLLAES